MELLRFLVTNVPCNKASNYKQEERRYYCSTKNQTDVLITVIVAVGSSCSALTFSICYSYITHFEQKRGPNRIPILLEYYISSALGKPTANPKLP